IKTDKKFLDEQRKKGIKKNRKYPDWVYEELKKNNINRDTFWRRVNTYKWSVKKACTPNRQIDGYYLKDDSFGIDKLSFTTKSVNLFNGYVNGIIDTGPDPW